jgi:type IV pilus assembly protein PilQ
MQMTHGSKQLGIALMAGFMWFAGCATSDQTPSDSKSTKTEPTREVREADALFQKGLYTDAIVACIDIARKDPLSTGLPELQARIMTRVSQLRREAIQAQQAATAEASAVDAMRHGVMPDTYRLKKHVFGDTTPLRTPPTKMQLALRQPVSIHLENVGLTEIVAQIGTSQNINMIADDSVAPAAAPAAPGEPPAAGATITIHVENTPLIEVLDYVGRNMNVSFNAGENIIWVTKSADNQAGPPLETRVYRLRKGLPGNEVPGGAALGADAQAGSGEIAIVDAIKRFVSQPDGSDLTFDTRAHALLVRNTRENLAMTEDIINALDVRPLQVLIEARFISTTASDTRALGIDWLLGGPVATPPPGANPHPTPHGYTGIKDTTGAAGVNANLNALTTPDGASLTASADGSTVSDKNVTFKGNPLGIGQLQDGAGSFLYQGVFDGLRLKAVLRAMESSGQTRTLTVPRVTTVNNRTAMIHIGEDFQYYDNLSTSSVNVYNNDGDPNEVDNNTPIFQGTPKTIQLGYKLTVTPSIGADLSTINLVLIPDITELLNKSDWEAANTPGNATVQEAGKLPIVLKKTVETEVVVRSGETVVMGGLAQGSGGKTRTGLPWLSDLPFLGWLFRTEEMNDGTDNLLIFVTATILSDVGEELIPLNPRERVGAEIPLAAIGAGLGSMLPEPMAAEAVAPAAPVVAPAMAEPAAAAPVAPAVAPAPVVPVPALLNGVLPPAAPAPAPAANP